MNRDFIAFRNDTTNEFYTESVDELMVKGIGSLEFNVFDKQIIYNRHLGVFKDSYFCDQSSEEMFFDVPQFEEIKISYKTFCDMFLRPDIYDILERTKELQKLEGKACQLTDKPV